jgi:ribosomal protein S18 acetylase RimI-like enzyme
MTPPRLVEQAQASRLGALLGRAFADDPVSAWTFGPPITIAHALTTLACRVYVPHGASFMVDGRGGAMWLRPGGSKALTLAGMAAIGLTITRHSGLGHLRRAMRVDDEMVRRRPKAPHDYLFAIGVLPEARGRGVGRSLLAHTLTDVDARKSAAYLESSNPLNEPLYRSFGFEVVDRFHPAPGCPPLAAMWREPTDARSGS